MNKWAITCYNFMMLQFKYSSFFKIVLVVLTLCLITVTGKEWTYANKNKISLFHLNWLQCWKCSQLRSGVRGRIKRQDLTFYVEQEIIAKEVSDARMWHECEECFQVGDWMLQKKTNKQKTSSTNKDRVRNLKKMD